MTQCQLDLFGNPKRHQKKEQKPLKSTKTISESLSEPVPKKEIQIEKKN